MNFKILRLEEFNKELKRLLKKFPTLEEDLDTFIKVQMLLHHKFKLENHGIFPIDNVGFEHPKIFKVKKFSCKSLKGKGVCSGIRLIYAYFPIEDRIEFLEIYFKANKEKENKERIITKGCLINHSHKTLL